MTSIETVVTITDAQALSLMDRAAAQAVTDTLNRLDRILAAEERGTDGGFVDGIAAARALIRQELDDRRQAAELHAGAEALRADSAERAARIEKMFATEPEAVTT